MPILTACPSAAPLVKVNGLQTTFVVCQVVSVYDYNYFLRCYVIHFMGREILLCVT